MGKWVSAFHIAQRGIFVETNNGMERTVRVVFPNNLNGSAVRLVLSNKYGDTPARVAEMPLNNETDKAVREISGDQPADAPMFRSLDILTEEGYNVAMLGDSITQMCYWYKPLTERLYKAYPGRIATGNQGIGGGRLCYDSPAPVLDMFGDAGYKRFLDEVVTINGLKYVMVSLGVNDLAMAGHL